MPARMFEKNQGGVGFTFSSPASYIKYWLESWHKDKPLLDLGCGHGTNTVAALNHGAKVVATDINMPSLEPHASLTCAPARLPHDIPFPENSFAGILCAEVFHFLSNEEVRPSINKLYSLLEPDGYLVITCASCEAAVLKETGIEQKIKAAWQTDPDHFSGYYDYIDLLERAAHLFNQPEITDPVLESHRENIPERFFNFYIPEQLGRACSQAGFEVLICETGPAPHYPVWLHGDKDQVRIIAHKSYKPI